MSSNLRPRWEKAAGHMQSVGRQQQGYSVVTIEILVGPDGDPILWFEPCVRKLSPLIESKSFLSQLLSGARPDFG